MRLLREPLLHFFVLGALIFAAFAWTRDPRASAARIVVTRGQIDHLADGFARTWQRPATAEELNGLVDEFVRDEVYYREATAAGLERDDSVVRRRLRQKMEFLVEDATAGPAPSDAALTAFLNAHPETFRREPALTLRQVFVSRERHGARADADARALLARLATAGPDATIDDLGDPSLLPPALVDAPLSDVARVYGDAFAGALAAAPVGRWSGPIASSYGLHVVMVQARTDGGLPALDQVRATVAREQMNAERKQMIERAYAALRARYEVVIEPIPSGGAAAVAAR